MTVTEVTIKQADAAFSRQISSQVARITDELNRLDQLLSAGLVDRRVVAEFRDAVDKVRQTSWHVQCWMDGDLQSLSSTLIEGRIQAASQLANLLIFDLHANKGNFSGITNLRDSVHKLDRVLTEEKAAAGAD
jgi:hypothetical protein